MLPGPLAPLDPHKTRALTTIYAPRKPKTRKNKTAQSRMLENDLPIKTSLSPFHPLPAIGQKIEKTPKTKVFVFDLNKNETTRSSLDNSTPMLHEVLKPLTPLRIHGFTRKNSLELETKKPQQLLRENTYDVIEPIYVKAEKMKRDLSLSRRTLTSTSLKSEKSESESEESKVSPKTRFKKAAMQVAKLSSVPETGKLLCLRERQTFNFCHNENETSTRLQALPRSPTQKLNKLSEIFQNLEMKGRHRDKMKKENSWF